MTAKGWQGCSLQTASTTTAFSAPIKAGAAIAAMLQRFHDTGSGYRWEWFDPLSDGATGYARFRFSYVSRLPECAGRPVAFDGMSQFRFAPDRLIQRYSESFDRGVALVQLGFPAERIRRILEKVAAAQG